MRKSPFTPLILAALSLAGLCAPAIAGDGILQATDGDLVTGRHADSDGGSGVPVSSFDTIVADCAGAENTGVAVVPGEEFGMAGHIRISYAVSEDKLAKGFDRMREAL